MKTLQRRRMFVTFPADLGGRAIGDLMQKEAAKCGMVVGEFAEIGCRADDFANGTLTAVFDVKRWLRPTASKGYVFN